MRRARKGVLFSLARKDFDGHSTGQFISIQMCIQLPFKQFHWSFLI
jgi:hypothetical protein